MNAQTFTPSASGRCHGGKRIGLRSLLSRATLKRQNRVFKGSGGVSAENCCCGFAPAFLDTETGTVYRARFADGRPAPMHLLEGLPAEVVVTRSAAGEVTGVKASVIAGFVRRDKFYTRAQAAAAVAG